MNYKVDFQKFLRWLSIFCFIRMIVSGYLYPVTIFQGVVINPLGLLACMALFTYSTSEHINRIIAKRWIVLMGFDVILWLSILHRGARGIRIHNQKFGCTSRAGHFLIRSSIIRVIYLLSTLTSCADKSSVNGRSFDAGKLGVVSSRWDRFLPIPNS
jgi:hypothetical protein